MEIDINSNNLFNHPLRRDKIWIGSKEVKAPAFTRIHYLTYRRKKELSGLTNNHIAGNLALAMYHRVVESRELLDKLVLKIKEGRQS